MTVTGANKTISQLPIWPVIYLAGITLCLLALLVNHYQIITAPVTIDFFESGMLVTTELIAQGKNPYSFASQPVFTTVYPPVYNIIAAPFSLIFGNTLLLHRIIAGLFILGCCGLLYGVTLRSSHSRLHSYAAATIFYAGLLFYSTPTASTNSTGLFFFLLSVCIPWLFAFSRTGLILSLACGLIAFYSKQYFIVGQAYLCLYLLLNISIKKSIQYGFSLCLIIAISIYLVYQSSPYYFNNTVFLVSSSVSIISSAEKILSQLALFLENYFLLIILLAIISLSKINGLNKAKIFRTLNLKHAKLPLLTLKLDYFWLCFFCSSLVIIFILGKNPGNHMTYLYQLMTPFLLIAGFTTLTKHKTKNFIVIPVVLVCLFQSYQILPKDFNITRNNWLKVDRLIEENETILASPMLMDRLLAHDKILYQGAGTVYFRLSMAKPDIFMESEKAKTPDGIWQLYTKRTWAMIEQERFDVILLTRWNISSSITGNPPAGLGKKEAKQLFKQHYELTETIPVSLTERPGGGVQEILVWKPRSN